MSTVNTDKQLIAACLRGEHTAFDNLMLKYQHRVKRVVNQYIPDPGLVSDVTQEVFLNAFHYINQFRGDCEFYTWVYRITINTVKNCLKKNACQAAHIDYTAAELLTDQVQLRNNINPEQIVVCIELEGYLTKMVNTLSAELRTAILLRAIGGLSYADIADHMDCPVGTVRSRISRARALIKTIL